MNRDGCLRSPGHDGVRRNGGVGAAEGRGRGVHRCAGARRPGLRARMARDAMAVAVPSGRPHNVGM